MTLAILGGKPVRDRPFLVEPMIGDTEEKLVVQAIRDRNFSRYIGSNAPDLERTLRLTSASAAAVTDYWHFLGGPNVRLFAAEFAEKFCVPYAVPINSATTGLSVALASCGVSPGDEVIVPAISYTATGTAPLMYHAIPVFVDVDLRNILYQSGKDRGGDDAAYQSGHRCSSRRKCGRHG